MFVSVRGLSGFHPRCKNMDVSLIRDSKLDEIIGLCPVVDWWPMQSAFFSHSVGMILWQKLDLYDLIRKYLHFKVIRYQNQFKRNPPAATWKGLFCSNTHVTQAFSRLPVLGSEVWVWERYPSQSQISLTCTDLCWGHTEAGLRDAWHFSLQHLTLRTTRSVCLCMRVPLCHRAFILE